MSMTPDLENQSIADSSFTHDPHAEQPEDALSIDVETAEFIPATASMQSQRRTFRMKKTAPSQRPLVATTDDYTAKYKEDPLFHELDENARVWRVYNDEARAFDVDMIAEASDSLDILLVFAGLFSAVLTTFLVQTSLSLSPDNGAITVALLKELVDLQRAQGRGTSLESISPAMTTSSPSEIDKWVNGLWFISLTLSLSDALVAVLAKQWLRQYYSRLSGTPRTRAILRQFRYMGFERWRVRSIIGFLPTILHISLILFLVGLVLLLIPLNTVIASILGGITLILVATYVLTNLLPVLLVQCPYRTPLNDLLYHLFNSAGKAMQCLLSPCIGRQHLSFLKGLYTSTNARESKVAFKWGESGSGIPKTLASLWSTTTNSSARRIVGYSLGSLGRTDWMLQGGWLREEQAYKEAYDFLANASQTHNEVWQDLSAATVSHSLSYLKEQDKVRVKRALLNSIVRGPQAGDQGLATFFESCQVLASDLDLALIAVAYDTNLGLDLIGDQYFPIETVRLQYKEAFSWALRHYHHGMIEMPVLPAIVWQRLWDGGKWKTSDFKPGTMPEGGKELIAQARKRQSESIAVGHGPMSLLDFLTIKMRFLEAGVLSIS